jgi:predicted RNA-binding Zn-ribbon protein involved in translation (DUF1610 family)
MPGNPQQTIVQTCAICGAQFQVFATVREALCPTCGATNQIGVRPVAARPVAARPAAARMPTSGVRGGGRPVVIIKDSGSPLFVVFMVLLMAGGGYAVYHFRDRIWTQREKMPEAPMEAAAPVDIDREYQQARMLLANGDKEAAREAAKTFRQLDGPGVQQPLRNWVTFHGGLAHLIAGEPQAAEDRFRKLGERAAFSRQPADAKLASFFLRAAEIGAKPEPVPVAEAEKLDRKDFESMGLLLYGLKNWALGKFDEASPFFTEFAKATPEAADEWVTDYRVIAEGFVSDRAEWKTADEAYTSAKDAPDKQSAALMAVKGARARLRSKQFTEELTKMETDLTAKVEAREAEQAKMRAAQEAGDRALIADLKKKTDELCLTSRFAEAYAAVGGAQVVNEAPKEELKLLQKRMYSLVRFQRNLAADLAAAGYRGGITKRDGKVVPGEVRRATETQIETVPWTDVSIEWLTKVASGFIDATERLDYKSDRQFDLGILLLQNGKKEEADTWMTKAGDIKWEYKEALIPLLDGPVAK